MEFMLFGFLMWLIIPVVVLAGLYVVIRLAVRHAIRDSRTPSYPSD